MANKQPTAITTNVLAKALFEKSKRTFSHRKSEIWHQANYFSPVYRDFIYKIITNPSLKIYASKNDESYIQNDPKEVPNNKLTRKFHNFIYFDVLNKTSLPHELGHAVDFWFGAGTPLTSVVILEDNKTLYDIFTEEFESNYQSIYNLIMDEYKNIIDSNIKPGAYDLIVKYMPYYKVLKKLNVDLKNSELTSYRRGIQKRLYDCGFVDVYYQFYTKNCFSILNNKYGLVLDALSSKFDLDGLYLKYHLLDYYKNSKTKPVQEFFANLFRSEVTSKSYEFNNLRKFLPKSFDAYEKLFSIVYDKILNNKKFTDLKIKIPEEEEQ